MNRYEYFMAVLFIFYSVAISGLFIAACIATAVGR